MGNHCFLASIPQNTILEGPPTVSTAVFRITELFQELGKTEGLNESTYTTTALEICMENGHGGCCRDAGHRGHMFSLRNIVLSVMVWWLASGFGEMRRFGARVQWDLHERIPGFTEYRCRYGFGNVR